jgi:hypothetical protein
MSEKGSSEQLPVLSADLNLLVERELESLTGSPRFKPYEEYANELRAWVLASIEDIRAQVASDLDHAQGAIDDIASAETAVKQWVRLLRPFACLLGAVAVCVIILDARDSYFFLLGTEGGERATWLIAAALALVALGVASNRREEFQAAQEQLSEKARDTQSSLNAAVGTATEEALTRAINAILGPRGILSFPKKAPRLVELNSTKVVPFRSLDYIKNFIEEHASSAVGVAGPRGSGKSTILNALEGDETFARGVVLLAAPVRYASADFTRRLFLEVATVIDDRLGGRALNEQRQRRSRVARVRLVISIVAAYVGLGLIVLDFTGTDLIVKRLSGVSAIGAALAATGLAGVSYTWLNMLSRRDRRRGSSETASAVADAIQSLRYDKEQEQTSKNVVRPFTNFLEVEDEDRIKLTSRVATQPDLVSEMRKLLTTLSRDPAWTSRFLIMIDELDKISEVDELIDVVNDLKTLFHITGVHFLVSVSLEALASFEQRGLPSRDAFDSSFDTVVGIEPLTPEESLRVLASRAEGFPPLLGWFCHAWSGGLPRDLLRHARRCVEIHRASARALPLMEIMSALVSQDLCSSLEALIRSDKYVADREGLVCVRDHIVRGSEGSGLHDLSPRLWDAQAPEVAAEVARLGQAILGFLGARSGEDWEIPQREVTEALTAVAAAMARRGDVAELRRETFKLAFELCTV